MFSSCLLYSWILFTRINYSSWKRTVVFSFYLNVEYAVGINVDFSVLLQVGYNPVLVVLLHLHHFPLEGWILGQFLQPDQQVQVDWPLVANLLTDPSPPTLGYTEEAISVTTVTLN